MILVSIIIIGAGFGRAIYLERQAQKRRAM
jgi:hypothetical protein